MNLFKLNNLTKPQINFFLIFTLVSLIGYEFLLFYRHFSHDILNIYPSNFDQTSYLMIVYKLYETVHQEGFSALFNHSSILATGFLFPYQTLLFFEIFGASRFSALLPNFIYFALLQISVFVAAKSLFSRYTYGFILIGLILSFNTPFYIGGITDYRMDFTAFCLYGIWCSLILQSNVFLHKPQCILIALISILMIYLRFITSIYFFSIAFGLIVVFTSQYIFTHSVEKKFVAKSRIRHLLIVCVSIFIALLPSIFLSYDTLYHYYVIMHTNSNEVAFRNIIPGTSVLSYYPKMIRDLHFGKYANTIIGVMVCIFLITYVIYKLRSILHLFDKSHKNLKPTVGNSGNKNIFYFLVLAIFCPMTILTLDPTKSSVVGSIIVIPVTWLIMCTCFYTQNIVSTYSKLNINNTILKILAFIIIVLGLYHQWYKYIVQMRTDENNQNRIAVTKMYDDIGKYAQMKQWPIIRISLDYVTDYLNHGSFLTLYYETHGKYLNFYTERLGSDLFSPITQQEALKSLQNSNVVILTIGSYPKEAFFPGLTAIIPFHDSLISYAESHLVRLGDYNLMGYHHRVYVSS